MPCKVPHRYRCGQTYLLDELEQNGNYHFIIISVSFVGFIATKNLVNLQFNHDMKDSHSALLSELNEQIDAFECSI